MPYTYGTKGMPAAGVAPGLPTGSSPVRGEISFTLPGTYQWTVPDGVFSVCAVAVGGGGSSYATFSGSGPVYGISAGAGGGLAWANNLPVTPGEIITIVVGLGGVSTSYNNPGNAGGTSYFRDSSTLAASGGQSGLSAGTPAGGAVLAGDGGGSGGAGTAYSTSTTVNAASGGAAAGYSGNGGNGTINSSTSNAAQVGSGAGSSGAANVTPVGFGGSGGVGLYGQGADGAAVTVNGQTCPGGIGGSGGQNGISNQADSNGVGRAGRYGAGAGVAALTSASGADGAVRIVLGDGRLFPFTDVSYS